MGIATGTAIALGLSAATTGYSIYQGIEGAKAESKANEAAANAAKDAQRLAELDKFAALNVPTLGLELAQQNMQAWQQSQIQALKEAGAAGALGGITNVGQQAKEQNLALAAQGNQLQSDRNVLQAQNAQQIESNRLQRQAGLINAQLGGAQTAASEARNQQNQAKAGAIQGLSSMAQLYGYQDIYGDKTAKANNAGNQPPLATAESIQKTAQGAFAPQMASMKPNVNPINVGNQLKANSLTGLRGAQGQYEAMQANQLSGLRAGQGQFDSQYLWNPYNNQWNQNVPY